MRKERQRRRNALRYMKNKKRKRVSRGGRLYKKVQK